MHRSFISSRTRSTRPRLFLMAKVGRQFRFIRSQSLLKTRKRYSSGRRTIGGLISFNLAAVSWKSLRTARWPIRTVNLRRVVGNCVVGLRLERGCLRIIISCDIGAERKGRQTGFAPDAERLGRLNI